MAGKAYEDVLPPMARVARHLAFTETTRKLEACEYEVTRADFQTLIEHPELTVVLNFKD